MKRYAYLTVWFLLVATALHLSSAAQRRGTTQRRPSAFPAKPGFYIQFSMCHACTYYGWQKDTVSALGKAGVQAFASDDPGSGYHNTEQPYLALQSLRLRGVVGSQRVTEDWFTPLYAGPFDSEVAARQVFAQLASILRSALDESDKRGAQVGSEPYSRPLRDCSGNHCTLAGYSVQLVSVAGASAQLGPVQDTELNIGILDEKANIYDNVIDWCYFKSPSSQSKANIFFVNLDETPNIFWLNIDGRLTALKLVGSSRRNLQRLTKGSSYTERYRSGDISAFITYVVVRKYPEGAAYTATVVVTRGNRSKTVKTACECG